MQKRSLTIERRRARAKAKARARAGGKRKKWANRRKKIRENNNTNKRSYRRKSELTRTSERNETIAHINGINNNNNIHQCILDRETLCEMASREGTK